MLQLTQGCIYPFELVSSYTLDKYLVGAPTITTLDTEAQQ